MITWEEAGHGSWRGKVGGRILFAIVPISAKEYGIWLLNDGSTVTADTLVGAQTKGEEMLQEWLKEAGLIAKPAKCDKCGDNGWFDVSEFTSRVCPCTKDPNSLWCFTNGVMKEANHE